MSFEKLDLSIMGAFNFACEHGLLAREARAHGNLPLAQVDAQIANAYGQITLALLLTRIADQLTLLRAAFLDLDATADDLLHVHVPEDEDDADGSDPQHLCDGASIGEP